MIPEAGQIALIIALCLSFLLGTVPMVGAWRGQRWAMNLAPSLAAGVFVFLSIAFACLTIVFLQDDFSVKVVASNSNSLLPPIYKFSAVWGNHEGSILLWLLVMTFFGFLFSCQRKINAKFKEKTLNIQNTLIFLISLFILLTSIANLFF